MSSGELRDGLDLGDVGAIGILAELVMEILPVRLKDAADALALEEDGPELPVLVLLDARFKVQNGASVLVERPESFQCPNDETSEPLGIVYLPSLFAARLPRTDLA